MPSDNNIDDIPYLGPERTEASGIDDIPSLAEPKEEPGILSKLKEFVARGAKVPGGAKTLDTFGSAINDMTNATTTGGADLIARLLTGNQHPVPAKYFQGKPQPLGKILREEYGWNPVTAESTGLVAGAVADPTSALTEFGRPVADLMDKASEKLYQTGFRNVTRAFPDYKQNYLTDAGKNFIDVLRRGKVLKGGSSARDVEKQLFNWQRKNIGSRMNELRSPLDGQTFDIREAMGPYEEFATRAAKDAGPEKIVQSFQEKLLEPDLEKYAEGATLDDMMRKARWYGKMASGKKGAQGDIFKMFARESEGKQAAANVSKGLRDFVRDRTLEANPGTADEIKQLYRNYGDVETAMPALRKMAKVEEGKSPFTQVDAMLAALATLGEFGAGHQGAAVPLTLLAAKKAGHYLTSPKGATRVGNLLRDASQYNIWDNMVRRGLMNKSEGEQ